MTSAEHDRMTERVRACEQLAPTRAERHNGPYPNRTSEPKPCTAGCVRGMVTDLNGAQWKCSHCGGSGREPLVPPRVIPGTPRSA